MCVMYIEIDFSRNLYGDGFHGMCGSGIYILCCLLW